MNDPITSNGTSGLSQLATERRATAKWCLAVFGVALLMRVGWGAVALTRMEDPSALEFPDEQQYWRMATSLKSGEGLKDEFGFRATRMPIYPAILSLVAGIEHGVIVAKAFHWIVGAAVAALTCAAASTFLGRRVGIVAGLCVAFDPFLVFFSSLLLTETLHFAALVGLWWIAWPMVSSPSHGVSIRRWIALGCMAAFCVYVRESSAGLVAVLLGFTVICRRFDGRTLVGAAMAAMIVVASLLPWLLRNHRVTGDWCWLTNRAGISLYDGVGPQADGSSDLADIQQMPAVEGLDEVAWNKYFMRASISAIRDDPARIVRLAWVKLLRTWNPFPNVETYQSKLVRFISAVWTCPLFALAALGVILLPRQQGSAGVRSALFLLLPALYLSALHSLFVGSVRYRLSAMPMLEVLAAVALIALADRVRGRRANCRIVDD